MEVIFCGPFEKKYKNISIALNEPVPLNAIKDTLEQQYPDLAPFLEKYDDYIVIIRDGALLRKDSIVADCDRLYVCLPASGG